MTAKELIEELQKLDPEEEIFVPKHQSVGTLINPSTELKKINTLKYSSKPEVLLKETPIWVVF